MRELPILGAALKLPHIERHIDWLRELPRDVEIQDFTRPGALDEDWEGHVAEIKKQLDGHEGRLGIHGPFFDFNVAACDPLIKQIVNKRLNQGLDVCAALGANQMVIHSPFSIWDHDNYLNYDNFRSSKLEAIHSNLKSIVDRAEDMGCTIVIENGEDQDPQYRLDIVEHMESPALALSIDTGHAHYMHRAHSAPPVDYFMKSANQHLKHMHIQDVDGYADRHWNPGEGSILWEPVFQTLAKLESKPRLILEIMDRGNFRKGADYLVELGVAR